jgi:hypothetical protein
MPASPYFSASKGAKNAKPAGAHEGANPMKMFLSAVALAFAVALATPVFAQMKDTPKTKADCMKAKDMKWDDKAGKCVKK